MLNYFRPLPFQYSTLASHPFLHHTNPNKLGISQPQGQKMHIS